MKDTMDREDYQQVKQIFQAALDVAPANLEDYLDEQCSGKPVIRREVERLLNSYESGYLEKPAIEKVAELMASDQLEAGQLFGHYKIVKKIGAGGMGEVYLAEDTKLNRQVALKVLPDEIAENDERVRRFVQEAKAASALNHQNILTVYEVGEFEGSRYIATELITGENLRKRLNAEPITLRETLDITLQVAAALNAAHGAGIVHRDIKPENIMVRDDGFVKVLDFGLAKLLVNEPADIGPDDKTITLVKTTPGMVMGTVAYMSPEQARGKEVDARSDIWSLGVVIYEMLTKRTPFAGETSTDSLAAILTKEPAPLDENTPAELQRIVRKSLQKNADERYQTVKDLLLDIKTLKREVVFSAELERSQNPHSTGSSNVSTGQISKNATPLLSDVNSTRNSISQQRSSAEYIVSKVKQHKFYFQLAFAALLVTTIGVSIWWFAFGRGKQPAATDLTSAGSFKTYKITNWANAAGELSTTAAFSGDGKFIAFGSTKTGTNSIWVKQTNTGDAIQVTKDEFHNRFPVFSPSGEEVVYYSDRGNSVGLWRVSLMGGQPKLVAEKIPKESKPRLWSKSGKIYFQATGNLFASDAESGEITGITDFPSTGNSVKVIRISADESHIAFLIVEDGSWKIKVKPVNSPQTTQLFDLNQPIENVVWYPDGKKLLFSQKIEEFYQIFSIGLDGGNPIQISSGDSDVFVQDVSPNGERILFSSVTETSDLWSIDKENAKESLTTAQIDGELWADVSPDSSTIVYQSVRNLRQGSNLLAGSIVKQPISKDGAPFQLVENGVLPQWSPDGETVAFLKLAGQEFEIWKVAKSGDLLRRISTGGIQGLGYTLSPYLTSQVKHLSWSPRGSGLAFPAKREGISNIWLAPADGSAERKLSDNQDQNQDLYCPIWAGDETGIAFCSRTIKPDSEEKTRYFIWFYGIETNAQRKLLETEESVRLLGLTKSADELIFAVRKEAAALTLTPPEVPIRAVSLKTGKVRSVTVLKDAYFYNIYLSPDKGSIGFTSRSSGNDDVWIAPLEGGEPRKLTGNNDPRLYYSSLAWSPDGKTIFFGKQTRFTLLSMLINQKPMEEKNEKSNE